LCTWVLIPTKTCCVKEIAEEILNELALAPELKVLALGSAGIFHGTELDLRDVGGRLGAGTLVRGSVRRAGGRVRISAGAVDARSGEYIWTQSFDRGLEDILAIQIEIAQAVSLNLRGSTLPMAGGISPASAPTPEAYTAYLRGRREWRQLTIAGCRNAIGEYTSTIARFPDYAQAYASLAIANNWLLFSVPRHSPRLPWRAAGRPSRPCNSILKTPTATWLWQRWYPISI
jgi:TolB-like protein